ncbi:hypothetical protein SAMN05444395_1152 [Flavobacterium fryxellicola]|uniref:Uncharacterized protein n=1 Tax=Flavobacterium fryxellicola TaxID=249352 RepID=A0A167VUP3_9FLAO|nr:hypothetical protein [Flavobacterium fryxellicola]OAB26771.1 hypothetical protein FBFR_12700 [Flavobacterium fryxellicola]SHN78987.1 hypothetical protein SAMN05444395_1152 [Flavobacterium fryxellicola]
MTVLPSIDILNKYSSNTRDKCFSDINSIFFNSEIDILFTKNYIEIIESEIDDMEVFSALLIELSDSNRLSINSIDAENVLNSQNACEKLYVGNVNNFDSLFVITKEENINVTHYKYDSINENTKNSEFLLFELLRCNKIILKYYNFKNDLEIQNIFKTLFNLPNKLGRINIYNRYVETNHFQFLKNKSIYYYNLTHLNYRQRINEYINNLAVLKNDLGRNVNLFTTSSTNLIHERKLFFNHFILTLDNSFNYTIKNEPNWILTIECDRKVYLTEWIKKNSQFRRLN